MKQQVNYFGTASPVVIYVCRNCLQDCYRDAEWGNYFHKWSKKVECFPELDNRAPYGVGSPDQ